MRQTDRKIQSDRQTGRQVAHYHEVPVQNEALSQEEYADILRIKKKRGNIKYSRKEKSIISGGTNPKTGQTRLRDIIKHQEQTSRERKH